MGGDVAADALRYLIATKPREVRVRRLSGFKDEVRRPKTEGATASRCWSFRLAKTCKNLKVSDKKSILACIPLQLNNNVRGSTALTYEFVASSLSILSQ